MPSRKSVVASSGNVFADLGYSNAQEHQTKAKLVRLLARAVARQKLTQREAARRLGIDQPKISAILKGRFRGFSVYRLMNFVAALGVEVEIVTRDAHRDPAEVVQIPVHPAIAG
ncbi:MAG TPA: helix-turn-helix transcriptional regulator [Planctomycetota bacterium]|jgi:predicted XRE-type DNA-binding protein